MSALHAMLAGATGAVILLAGVASRDTKPVQQLLGKSTEVRILARLDAIESELSSLSWDVQAMSELESSTEEVAQQLQEISLMVDDLEDDLEAVSKAVGADSMYTPTVLEDVQRIKDRLNL